MNFQIAEVNFIVKHSENIELWTLDPAHQIFFKPKKQSSLIINIEIEIGLPPIDQFEHVFSAGEAWQLYKCNQTDRVAIIHSVAGSWIALFDQKRMQVKIYCNEGMIKNRNGQDYLYNPVGYPLNQILLMYILAPRQGCLLHAAGLTMTKGGLIFPGRSGAGKTTLTNQIISQAGFELLSDDRIVVRKQNHAFTVYGTPWPGEAEVALNTKAPLRGIFFLSRSQGSRITPIKPQEAFKKLLPVTSIPWYDGPLVEKSTAFLEDLSTTIPAYEFSFTPGPEVGLLLQEFMENEPAF